MNLGINVDRLFTIHELVVGADTAALTQRQQASTVLAAIVIEMDARAGDHELYASLLEKAAVLATGIVRRVPFATRNWRTAAAAVDSFLALNGVQVDLDDALEVDLWLYDLAEKGLEVTPAATWLAGRVVFD